MKDFSFNFQNKKIKIFVKRLSGIEKAFGLMFSSRKNAKALLFEFKKPAKISFTSLFVFFPFLIIWLDKQNNVLGIKKIKPFTLSFSSETPFYKALEIPLNDYYKEIINKFNKSSRKTFKIANLCWLK